MKKSIEVGLALLAACSLAGAAQAQTVFSETFDAGVASFTGDPYWLDNASVNGFVTMTTNTPLIQGGAFADSITTDASGAGYFLFNGTAGEIPSGQDQFYVSSSFAVEPNTDYILSFKLTNANLHSAAQIVPELGGTTLGTFAAIGEFATDGWQSFTVGWNSGAATSASLILHDLETATLGNDFGLDEISIVASPEPASAALFAAGIAGMGLLRRRRR